MAPPGFYMLFIVDDAGVPSVAKMVQVGGDAPPPPPPTANQTPTVTLTQPPNGASFTPPATVSLAATASDTDGHVTTVQFLSNGATLGEDVTAPFTFTWSGVGSGRYALTAKATDDDGATTTSSASTIKVNAPPTASITSPANGTVFPRRSTITTTATATDSDGSVTRVQFRDGGTVLGQDTTAPYSYTSTNVAPGSHTLRVRDRQRRRRHDERAGRHQSYAGQTRPCQLIPVLKQ